MSRDSLYGARSARCWVDYTTRFSRLSHLGHTISERYLLGGWANTRTAVSINMLPIPIVK
jgi:hypothetical protein